MRTNHRQFKDSVYEHLAVVSKALSASKRWELLDLLSQSPRTVEDLAKEAGLNVANASRHLQVLRASRMVDAIKKGLYVEYRLADEKVLRFLHELRDFAASRTAEVERMTKERFQEWEAIETVSIDELKRRMRSGKVTVIDVRPSEEYRAGHIPGALSCPLPALRKKITELPRSREVIAYCRGPYCVMAVEAAAWLRKKGFRVRRMDAGVSDWRARGWRVASNPMEVNP